MACTVAVLQATTIILASRPSRKREMREVRSSSWAAVFSPYGTWPLSARKSMLSWGISFRIARQMERPPTPESNAPIGLLSIAASLCAALSFDAKNRPAARQCVERLGRARDTGILTVTEDASIMGADDSRVVVPASGGGGLMGRRLQ